MAKKKRRTGRKPEPSLPRKLLLGLQEADSLFRRQRWAEAKRLLEDLDDRFPDRKEVAAGLVEACYRAGDRRGYLIAAERLNDLAPNKADVTLRLAGAYAENGRLFMALRTLRRFLDRWPDHPRAEEARRTAAEMDAETEEILREQGLTGPDGRELALLEEEMVSWGDTGRFDRAREAARRLTERRPDYPPAWNNLGETYFREGDFDQAIATARKVLGFAPQNVHARSNLTRYLFLSGRTEEALESARLLEALPSDTPDVGVKKAEALAYLGDDQGVLDALQGAERSAGPGEAPHRAMLYHLAAVAAFRLGREDEAKEYWKTALQREPGFSPALDNLEDLRLPAGERNAPWPFPLPNWLLKRTIDGLVAVFGPKTPRPPSDEAISRRVQDYFRDHPELPALIPALLDRGDPDGRWFALRLALIADTPATQAALQDFALGQRGPDELRMEAAQAAMRVGLIQPGKVQMWLKGERVETLLFGFELTGEPVNPYPPRVEPFAREALEALRAGDGKRGEKLLRRALETDPDSPALLNNLASAYQIQGRNVESEALVRELYRRFPDYLFARTNLANIYIRDGELDKARELLDPLLSRRQLHFSEFASLCASEVQLALEEGKPEVARSWLEMWERAEPDHPHLHAFKARVRKHGRKP